MPQPKKPPPKVFYNAPVASDGDPNADIMVISLSPDKAEYHNKRAFTGNAGNEYEMLLDRYLHTDRNKVYQTNLFKYYIEDDGDPTPDQINQGIKSLMVEIERVDPSYILVMGTATCRALLSDYFVSMEHCFGIPYFAHGRIWVPCYHSSAGLYREELANYVHAGFEKFAAIIRDSATTAFVIDDTPVDYRVLSSGDNIEDILGSASICAVDTEYRPDTNELWSVQISVRSYQSLVIMANDKAGLDSLAAWYNRHRPLMIFHNAGADLGHMLSVGIDPGDSIADTIIMANNLGDEPRKLKVLAYRIARMRLSEYRDVVAPAADSVAADYLRRILDHEWCDPEPELTYRKGVPHIKQPQNITAKINRILKKYDAGAKTGLHAYWDKNREQQIIDRLGEMPSVFLSDVDSDDAIKYAAMDSDATIRIYPYLRDRVKAMGLQRIVAIDCKATRAIIAMETTGVMLDTDYLRELNRQFSDSQLEYEARIETTAGRHINPKSTLDVKDLLRDLGYPVADTKAKTLTPLGKRSLPIQNLLEARKFRDLVSKYTSVMPSIVDAESRIHTRYSLIGARTGRLASRHINLQNVPSRTPEGKCIRRAFKASDGCLLAAIDYSQQELRMLAHLSHDTKLLSIYNENRDLHTETAAGIWGVEPADVKDEWRKVAKSVSFGTVYLISARGLYEDIITKPGINPSDWSVHRCQNMLDGWGRTYPGAKAWMTRVEEELLRTSYVTCPFGKRRLIRTALSPNPYVRNRAIRQAVNHPIQGGCASFVKIIMAKVQRYCEGYTQTPNDICRLIMQIHDKQICCG